MYANRCSNSPHCRAGSHYAFGHTNTKLSFFHFASIIPLCVRSFSHNVLRMYGMLGGCVARIKEKPQVGKVGCSLLAPGCFNSLPRLPVLSDISLVSISISLHIPTQKRRLSLLNTVSVFKIPNLNHIGFCYSQNVPAQVVRVAGADWLPDVSTASTWNLLKTPALPSYSASDTRSELTSGHPAPNAEWGPVAGSRLPEQYT
jgi:hypothetical protein